ncbi:hypothetical protein TNCV_4901141 [Trichonephila clavipes]|nr:hypothetical protein TNCV_4901141 [Trichonephila clavipes]
MTSELAPPPLSKLTASTNGMTFEPLYIEHASFPSERRMFGCTHARLMTRLKTLKLMTDQPRFNELNPFYKALPSTNIGHSYPVTVISNKSPHRLEAVS